MPPDFKNPISPEHLLTNHPRITAKRSKANYENLCMKNFLCNTYANSCPTLTCTFTGLSLHMFERGWTILCAQYLWN